MVLILEFLLADVAQDDAVAAALPATLRLLRRRRPVEVASTPVRSRWCGRLTELLRSDCASARHAGIALVVETATQLDEAAFAAHREPWAVTLLSLSTQRSGGDAIRSASAAALTELLAVASRWPVQRRDAAVHAPRLLGALLSMAERPSASATADADVGGCSVEAEVVTSTLKLARVAPHCAWGETVASLSGTLHALLRTALGSLTAQPLCSTPPPAAALPSPGAEAEALLAAATGHALAHLRPLVEALQLCWRRTSPAEGLPHLRCPRLRAATYELAAALLTTLGAAGAEPLGDGEAHPQTLARALVVFSASARTARSTDESAVAHAALHSLDALLHPSALAREGPAAAASGSAGVPKEGPAGVARPGAVATPAAPPHAPPRAAAVAEDDGDSSDPEIVTEGPDDS
ncbi:hypothetical protein EMIHUDRAFT_197293 [Emiliania huxleyi CCMP1516]|uniref:Pre-rRNA-processing protein RIX1 N-terminal domain-containing protein n=2 Tax=Emiliania huxleyi TaxID=2903 RepID=A0A0D3IU15_EMIH1|nr:hypothetical protein EMIHUDRAFT_197293 [Emiliania huxleyi CCMP1516]EOD14750.1 hypothetical protein EMIHUDRAFT_197293 [Emiliania huxleyi CCMP1516]|eukprot:XP_005767179.1 hypothetical protein EMIHUDRAFT_197293 [Emiliania huxleyi CCMP1516]